MARLVILSTTRDPLLFEIVKPRVTIGRSDKSDLVLNDANVSRNHAVVELTPQGYRISDQNSRNGILVDDRRCTTTLLKDGTTVRLGDSLLRFEEGGGAWQKTKVFTGVQTTVDPSVARKERGVMEIGLAFRCLAEETPEARSVEELQQALREAKRRALLFELICNTRHLLQGALGTGEVLKFLAPLVFSATQAERVMTILWDDTKQCFRPAEIHTAPGMKLKDTELALSQSLLNTVLQSRKPVLVRDARADPELLRRQSVVVSGLRSAVCAPIVVQDRLHGLLYADNCRLPKVFDEDDLELVSILAMEAAMALDTARAREDLFQQERIRLAYRCFLPEHLAELLITKPDAVELGGSRQFVTVLFADLRSFTSLAENLPPEDAVELLNAFFTEMTAVIFRHGGMVDKFLGDGLLAVFGAPLSEPTDALRGVRCAIAMQESLEELQSEWQRQSQPVIHMGIGINSGEAIAGNIGSPQRMEYTVIGDTVNVAARLTSVAGPGEILLGESTHQQVQQHIAAEPLPPLQLKGKREPARVYRVLRKAFDTGPLPVETRSTSE